MTYEVIEDNPLGEAIIHPVKLVLEMIGDDFSIEIDQINSLECIGDCSMESFIDLSMDKIAEGIKKSIKNISYYKTLKVVFFFFWRLLSFIFFKRNIKTVNKSCYKLIKEKF